MSFKHIIAYVGILMAPIGVMILGAGSLYLWYKVNACITEVRQSISPMPGLEFKISETDCSTLGEDASVSVYGIGERGKDERLLFRYDPGPDVLPTIEVLEQGRIVMTIPAVSEVIFQERKWMSFSIDYNIGHIDYPRPGAGEAR